MRVQKGPSLFTKLQSDRHNQQSLSLHVGDERRLVQGNKVHLGLKKLCFPKVTEDIGFEDSTPQNP